jgi:hypothetical protein
LVKISCELWADKLRRSLIGQEFWTEISFDPEFLTDAGLLEYPL